MGSNPAGRAISVQSTNAEHRRLYARGGGARRSEQLAPQSTDADLFLETRNAREIKASEDFIRMRETVLGIIYGDERAGEPELAHA